VTIFPIKRHDGGSFKGLEGTTLKGVERIERKEEERRGNEVKTLPNRDRDQSLRRFLFCVLRAAVS